MITQILAEQLLNNPVSEGLGLLLKLDFHLFRERMQVLEICTKENICPLWLNIETVVY